MKKQLIAGLVLVLFAAPAFAAFHPSKREKEFYVAGVAAGALFNKPIRKAVAKTAKVSAKSTARVAKAVYHTVR